MRMNKMHYVAMLLLLLGVCQAIAFGVALSIASDPHLARGLRIGAGAFLIASVIFAFAASAAGLGMKARPSGEAALAAPADHVLSMRDFEREARAAIARTAKTREKCAVVYFEIGEVCPPAETDSAPRRLRRWSELLSKLEVALRSIGAVATIEDRRMTVLVSPMGRPEAVEDEIAVFEGVLTGAANVFVERERVVYARAQPQRPLLGWRRASLA